MAPPDLSFVKVRQLGKYSFSFWQEADSDKPMVACALFFANQSATLCPLDEPHHGVVAFLQEFGQFGDRRPALAGIACNT